MQLLLKIMCWSSLSDQTGTLVSLFSGHLSSWERYQILWYFLKMVAYVHLSCQCLRVPRCIKRVLKGQSTCAFVPKEACRSGSVLEVFQNLPWQTWHRRSRAEVARQSGWSRAEVAKQRRTSRSGQAGRAGRRRAGRAGWQGESRGERAGWESRARKPELEGQPLGPFPHSKRSGPLRRGSSGGALQKGLSNNMTVIWRTDWQERKRKSCLSGCLTYKKFVTKPALPHHPCLPAFTHSSIGLDPAVQMEVEIQNWLIYLELFVSTQRDYTELNDI